MPNLLADLEKPDAAGFWGALLSGHGRCQNARVNGTANTETGMQPTVPPSTPRQKPRNRDRLRVGSAPSLILRRRLFGKTYRVLSRISTSKVSRMSPDLMSLVSCSTTPHSRPARTSATSSLKRRSEAIVVLVTMTSSRVMRAWEALADIAVGDQQARRLVLLARREDLLDLGAADNGFDALRSPDPGHFLGDVFGEVVDHVEVLHPPPCDARPSRAPWRWGGRLKPITGAPAACARLTSLSVIAPTPECSTFTLISSFEILLSALTIASVEPWTSAFTTTGYSSTVCLSLSAENMFSRLAGAEVVRLAVACSWR